MYWQANVNTPLSVTPLLNGPYKRRVGFDENGENDESAF